MCDLYVTMATTCVANLWKATASFPWPCCIFIIQPNGTFKRNVNNGAYRVELLRI